MFLAKFLQDITERTSLLVRNFFSPERTHVNNENVGVGSDIGPLKKQSVCVKKS